MHIRHGKIYGFTEVGEKFVSDELVYERKYYVFCKCTYRSKIYHYLNYAQLHLQQRYGTIWGEKNIKRLHQKEL